MSQNLIAPVPPVIGGSTFPPPPGSSAPAGKYEFFTVVQEYLDRAAAVIQLPEYVRVILSQPKNEIIVHFPVKMENGEIRLFKGLSHSALEPAGAIQGGAALPRERLPR